MQDKNLLALRHSAEHVLMQAMKKLYPKIKMAMGPATDDGFYFDFEEVVLSKAKDSADKEQKKISIEDFPKIEKEMQEIIKSNLSITKKEISVKEARELFKGNEYKQDWLDDIEKRGEKPTVYYTGDNFVDLCVGPHVKSTGEIKAFKLTKIAGAYWHGDEKNKMLTRIYGIAFDSKSELKKYLEMLVEAEKRDHRKLGKELDLYVFSDLVGKGLPLLTPKGTIIFNELKCFIEDEETKRGYLRTYTPDLAKVELYKKSGHWDHYKESMYPPMDIDGEKYVLRPMTCPHQFMIYNSRPRSYRELPLRYAETAKQYRKEQSGELSGLIRLMAFTLVDAHLICRPDQMEEEFKGVVDLVQYSMKVLGIEDYWYRFSKWDPKNKKKYVDNPKAWQTTEKSMKKILDEMKLEYVEAEDEAAFYGPKLDVQMRNVNGKEDTAFTIQIDFALPEKFDMTYVDKGGKEKRPMIIHRASIGCLERTMAFLIERYAGEFPVWLSPVQVKIVAVSEGHVNYCNTMAEEFKAENIRVEVDSSDETVGKKIRKAITEKVPYVLVVGDKEMKSKNLHVRKRGSDKVEEIAKKKFVENVKKLVESRSQEL